MLELPPRSIRGSETELVPVKLDFDVWAIQHSPRTHASRVVLVGVATAAAVLRSQIRPRVASRGKLCAIQRDGEREDGPLLW